MDIIVHDPGRYHVSLDTVWEFEEIIGQDPNANLISSEKFLLSQVPNLVWRALFQLRGFLPRRKTKPCFDPLTMMDSFAVMMGPNLRKTMPRFFQPGRKSAYIFDAWPRNHDKFRVFADTCELDHLFISSSQGAAEMGRLVKKTACHWVPEGITPGDYYLAFKPEKDIDVLQLGRRYDSYHQLIAPALEKNRKVYRYEREPGHVVFPTRIEYVEGLARAKISVCVPVSRTHPARAGGIETMTVRYLQSMLSRCLIVGHAPAEMIQLFGYNPLIEIDYNDPANQLLGILSRMDEYQPLIERNHQLVRQQHTWVNRWQRVLALLNGGGNAAPEA